MYSILRAKNIDATLAINKVFYIIRVFHSAFVYLHSRKVHIIIMKGIWLCFELIYFHSYILIQSYALNRIELAFLPALCLNITTNTPDRTE